MNPVFKHTTKFPTMILLDLDIKRRHMTQKVLELLIDTDIRSSSKLS